MSDQPPRRGRSRWTRTVEERFAPGTTTPEAAPRLGGRVPGGSEAILLVEDQDQVREATRTILERLGYHVEAVRTAPDALAWIAGGTPVDLLLTDVVLPGMNGVALAEQLVTKRPGLRILFMSAYTNQESIPERSLHGSPCAFLAKPFSLDVLARTVRGLLDR
jgi:DNA-binding NtrC family response regulator